MKKLLTLFSAAAAIFIISCSPSNNESQREYETLTLQIQEAKQNIETLKSETIAHKKNIQDLIEDKTFLNDIKNGVYKEFLHQKRIEKKNLILSVNKLKKNKIIMEDFLSGKRYIVTFKIMRSDGLKLNFKSRTAKIDIEVSKKQYDRYTKGEKILSNSAIRRHLSMTVYDKRIM